MSDQNCPTCHKPFTDRVLRWAGEPVPTDVICSNVTSLHISQITVTCPLGHAFTCREHTWDAARGDRYEGLVPLTAA